MICKETERLIIPYLNGELSEKRTKEFLTHIKKCESCYEEMEISYMASTGLERLESGSSIDIENEMMRILMQSERKLKQRHIIKIVTAVVDVIAMAAVIVTLIFQTSVWATGNVPDITLFGIEIGEEK